MNLFSKLCIKSCTYLFSKVHTTKIIKQKNLYEILGVPRDASQTLIEETFKARNLLIQREAVNDSFLIDHMSRLKTAYTILSNTDLRKHYDMDLKTSDQMSNYIRNVVSEIQFEAPPSTSDSMNISTQTQEDLKEFHVNLEEDTYTGCETNNEKIRHFPKDIVTATTLPNTSTYRDEIRFTRFVYFIVFLLFAPDIVKFFYYNWDDKFKKYMSEIEI